MSHCRLLSPRIRKQSSVKCATTDSNICVVLFWCCKYSLTTDFWLCTHLEGQTKYFRFHNEKTLHLNLLQYSRRHIYIILFVYNKLRAWECVDETRSCYLIFRACCLGIQFWELIITNDFDETLLKKFRMTTSISDAVKWDRSIGWSGFMLSIARSHVFFNVH